MINCDESILAFDIEQGWRILGGRRLVNDSIEYLIEYKDGWPMRVVSAPEAISKWPKLVLTFLESHIKMVGPKKQVSFVDVTETLDTIGEPIRVTCKYEIMFGSERINKPFFSNQHNYIAVLVCE